MKKGFRTFILVLIVSLCTGILLAGCNGVGKEYDIALTKNLTPAGYVTGAGRYVEGSEVTIAATTNIGYTFLGWFEGEEKVSANEEYTFTMPAGNKTYEASWSINSYNVILNKNIADAGTVTGDGSKKYGSSVTLTATTNIGYTFLGWFEGEEKVSANEEYTFTMPASDKTYEARWSINSYDVVVGKNIDNAGTISGDGFKEYGSSVTLTATTNEGYTWLGWFDNDTKVSANEEYTFTMPASDKTYEARWEINYYDITLNKNIDNAGTVNGGGSKEYGSSVTLTATTNIGYTFLGWFEGEEKVSANEEYTFTMPASDKTYEARWSINSYDVVVGKNIDNAGTISGGGFKEYGSSVTLTATTNIGYTFLGWFEGEEKVSADEELTYIFIMPASNKTYEAKWSINSYDVIVSKNINNAGTVTGDGFKEYGSSVTLTATTNEGYTWLGWFDGETKASTDEELTYTFVMPAGSKTYEARWSINSYDVITNKNIDNAGTVTGGGTKVYGSSVTLTATTNAGYTWLGWFDGEVKVSTNEEYTFTMPASDKTYEARWSVNSYNVITNKNIDNAGTVTGGGSKEYGSSVTLTATTNAGYTWLGWFDGETKVSADEELTYTFVMPVTAKTYEARWSINSYDVVVGKNIDNAGTATGGGTKVYGSSVKLTATTKAGYTWLGWFDGETKVSTGTQLTYTFPMPAENKEYEARWEINYYDITLNKNIADAGTVTGGGSKEYGSSVTLTATTNEGYTWLGWFEGTKRVSANEEYTFTMPAGNKTYEASWSINSYNVILNKNIDDAGTVTGDGSKKYGSSVTLTATTNIGYIWLGWFEDEEKVSTDEELTYTFVMPATAKTYEAKWEIIEKGNYEADGYAQVGAYLWFGEYPQSIKEESVIITETLDSRGYYLGSDGCYYTKVTATPKANGYTFSTGDTVITGTAYYFKVEPIKWRILSESDGNALIICESILANKQYYKSTASRTIDGVTVYANNYEHSDIRAWLNNEFYNTAFSALQQQLIQITELDNSEDSTGYIPNQYVCGNTFDKIFLPSYRDATNTNYGFTGAATRQKPLTDYTRATGGTMTNGNGFWWVRSPHKNTSYEVRDVTPTGWSYTEVNNSWVGVVPALTIRLP